MCGKGSVRTIRSDRDGSTSVEFAILSPVLILFILGLLVAGWAIHCSQTVRLALEQGGRALQIDESLTEQDLADLVRSKLTSIGDPAVSVVLTDDASVPGVRAKKLSARYAFSLPVPFYGTYEATYSTAVKVPLATTSGR